MVICLERGANLHMAQLMPLPLTVSCFSKIQVGFTFLLPAHLGSPGKRAVKRVCVCVCVCVCMIVPETSVFWLLKTIAKIQWVVSCPVQVELDLLTTFFYTEEDKKFQFYWSKRQWVAVASAGPYASLHLAPDWQPHQHPTTLFFYQPDALPAVQPTASKHCGTII